MRTILALVLAGVIFPHTASASNEFVSPCGFKAEVLSESGKRELGRELNRWSKRKERIKAKDTSTPRSIEKFCEEVKEMTGTEKAFPFRSESWTVAEFHLYSVGKRLKDYRYTLELAERELEKARSILDKEDQVPYEKKVRSWEEAVSRQQEDLTIACAMKKAKDEFYQEARKKCAIEWMQE